MASCCMCCVPKQFQVDANVVGHPFANYPHDEEVEEIPSCSTRMQRIFLKIDFFFSILRFFCSHVRY